MGGGAGAMGLKIVGIVGDGLWRREVVLAKMEGIDWERVEIFSSQTASTTWKERPGVPVPGFGSAAPCHDDYALMWRSWPFTSPLG